MKLVTLFAIALLCANSTDALAQSSGLKNPYRIITPETFGASHSVATITCDTVANSSALACPAGTGDFAVGQGVDIPLAGDGRLPPPTGLTLAVDGKGGDKTYAYALCSADFWKGVGGCIQQSLNHGPDELNALDSISLGYDRNLPIIGGLLLVYRRVDDGDWHFVTTLNGYPFKDIGWTQPDSAGWPASPPDGPINRDFFSTVTAIKGNTITLADAVPVAIAGAIVKHDDVLAVQAAYDACQGGAVQFGPYHYRLVRPSVWSYATRQYYYRFGPETPGYPSLFPQGIIHPPSNCATLGAGRGATFLLTDFMSVQNGAMAVFGFATGTHANLSVPSDFAAVTHLIRPAQPGARTVTTINTADAEKFAAGDYMAVQGGAFIAGVNAASNEINRVVSVDGKRGIVTLAMPLEKPVPVGKPGVPPSIVNLTGNIVTNISIAHMTIETYSTAFTNISAVYGAQLSDLYLPFFSNGTFWYGAHRRGWTNRNIDIAGMTTDELDLDEDFLWEGGSCNSISGDCFVASEASSNIRIHKTRLSGSDRLGAYAFGVVAAQGDINGFEISDSTLMSHCSASNAQIGVAVAVTGGILDGYIPKGLIIANNRIETNCRYAIEIHSDFAGLRITGNRIAQTLTNTGYWRGIAASGGMIADNLVEITAPPGFGGDNYGIGGAVLPPQAAGVGPWTIRNNTIRVLNGNTRSAIYIGDGGALYKQPIVVSGNRFENVDSGVFIANPENTPNVTVSGNQCLPCTAPDAATKK